MRNCSATFSLVIFRVFHPPPYHNKPPLVDCVKNEIKALKVLKRSSKSTKGHQKRAIKVFKISSKGLQNVPKVHKMSSKSSKIFRNPQKDLEILRRSSKSSKSPNKLLKSPQKVNKKSTNTSHTFEFCDFHNRLHCNSIRMLSKNIQCLHC